MLALLVAGALAVLVAPSAAAAAECPNESFRIGPGAFLPDCRAYEQASPVDKNGAGISGLTDYTRAAAEGSGITFFDSQGNGFPSETGGAQTFGTYLASKGVDVWSTRRLMGPQSLGPGGPGSNWLGSTPDLRYSLVEVEESAFANPTFGRGLYLLDNSNGEITMIVPREANKSEVRYAFDGASKDSSRFFFETTVALTPDAEGFGDHLYMWDRATGQVTLAGLLPAAEGGVEPEGGDFGGAYEWWGEPETSGGGALYGLGVESAHAISPDGDQIYFTAGETGQIYLRRGLTGSAPTTVHVSAPAPGAPAEPRRPAAFQEATPDGSKAFFLSSQKLTADATTGPSDEGKDLYRWDSTTDQLVDIAPDSGDPAGAQVRGLVGIAEDGRSGYFVAEGDLATGASEGDQNLYRFSEEAGSFAFTFIGTLSPRTELHFGDERNYSPRSYDSPFVFDAESRWFKTARTTPDGDELLFTTSRPLTGYDNVNDNGSITGEFRCNNSGGPQEHRCNELFLYRAPTASLACISCDPSGEPPVGSARLRSPLFNVQLVPGEYPNVSLPRNISADGSRIFFESPDPLLPRDTNAASGCTSINEVNAPDLTLDCLDVYEWEALGAPGGSCPVAHFNGGCLYLLSTGQSDESSYFLDASEDGSNVYVGTTSRLVPSDRDSVYDAYDVRSGGGLASQFAVAEPPCEGEACLGPPAPNPAAGDPGSSQLQGSGNLKQPKKHHKKKHHKKKRHHKGKSGSEPRDRSAKTKKEGR